MNDSRVERSRREFKVEKEAEPPTEFFTPITPFSAVPKQLLFSRRFRWSECTAMAALVLYFQSELRFPKLDVAGSIPVSRSMFSTIYRVCSRPEPSLTINRADRPSSRVNVYGPSANFAGTTTLAFNVWKKSEMAPPHLDSRVVQNVIHSGGVRSKFAGSEVSFPQRSCMSDTVRIGKPRSRARASNSGLHSDRIVVFGGNS